MILLGCVLPLLVMAQKRLVSIPKDVFPMNNNDSLFCYYFPVKENISSHEQPFYKEKPTLNDILQVAKTMPCDSFVVKRQKNVILTVNLQKDSIWKFTVRSPTIRLDTTLNAELIGAMTEHRCIDLINNSYDKKAGQVFGKLNFNNEQIPYISTKNLENAVFKVVDYFLYTEKVKK